VPEALLVGVVVSHLDDFRTMGDERALLQRSPVLGAAVQDVSFLRQRPAQVMIAWDDHKLARRQPEAAHEVLEEEARGGVLLRHCHVRDVPGDHEGVEPLAALLPQVGRELRVPEGRLIAAAKVQVGEVQDPDARAELDPRRRGRRAALHRRRCGRRTAQGDAATAGRRPEYRAVDRMELHVPVPAGAGELEPIELAKVELELRILQAQRGCGAVVIEELLQPR
jgi:hypothetical protein